MSGAVQPGSRFNPTKATPSVIETLDFGKVTVMEWSPEFIKVQFHGKKLKGLFILQREEPKSPIWLISRTHIPTPETKEEIFVLLAKDGKPPPYIDIHGMIFRPGNLKNRYYPQTTVKGANLQPLPGRSLCYVDLFHEKEEKFQVGILKEIYWDSNHEWTLIENGEKQKGALMHKSVIVDPYTISQILSEDENALTQVSAEVMFEGGDTLNDPVTNMEIYGMAMTFRPACKECELNKVCSETECVHIKSKVPKLLKEQENVGEKLK